MRQRVAGEGGANRGEIWGPEEAEDGSARLIPETLLRSKADCPAPPDALNAAIDKPVITEVIGVLRAVHAENKIRGKDKRKGRDDSSMSLAEVCALCPLGMYRKLRGALSLL